MEHHHVLRPVAQDDDSPAPRVDSGRHKRAERGGAGLQRQDRLLAEILIDRDRRGDLLWPIGDVEALRPYADRRRSKTLFANGAGAPLINACNLANAITEPVKVIAPITTPSDISMRLAVLIAPTEPMPYDSGA